VKYLLIRDNDRGTLAAIIAQDFSGKIWYTAYNKNYESVLETLLRAPAIYVEERADDRTVIRKRLGRGDDGYLNALKMKLAVPYVPHAMGNIKARTPQEAMTKLWKLFSPGLPREIIGG